MDQAQSLRQLVSSRDSRPEPGDGPSARIITVCSGKGGVGKSNFTLNFALALKAMGRRVLLFDADIGMANIDVLMGVTAKYNLYHLLKREADIGEIIQKGPGDLPFIAGGSGMDELFPSQNPILTISHHRLPGLPTLWISYCLIQVPGFRRKR